jgi:hypothetical protein
MSLTEAKPHSHERKNVFVLALSQALSMSGMSMVMTASALTGLMLADDKSLATVPMALQFVAAMITTIPASLFMGRYGRRIGFSVGQTLGACGALLATYAIYTQSFWLFATASLLLGIHVAFWQYFRFAAADSASPDFKAKAISYVWALYLHVIPNSGDQNSISKKCWYQQFRATNFRNHAPTGVHCSRNVGHVWLRGNDLRYDCNTAGYEFLWVCLHRFSNRYPMARFSHVRAQFHHWKPD